MSATPPASPTGTTPPVVPAANPPAAQPNVPSSAFQDAAARTEQQMQATLQSIADAKAKVDAQTAQILGQHAGPSPASQGPAAASPQKKPKKEDLTYEQVMANSQAQWDAAKAAADAIFAQHVPPKPPEPAALPAVPAGSEEQQGSTQAGQGALILPTGDPLASSGDSNNTQGTDGARSPPPAYAPPDQSSQSEGEEGAGSQQASRPGMLSWDYWFPDSKKEG